MKSPERIAAEHALLLQALIVARDEDDYCHVNKLNAMPSGKRALIDMALLSAGSVTPGALADAKVALLEYDGALSRGEEQHFPQWAADCVAAGRSS